jgi:hypothetical protein
MTHPTPRHPVHAVHPFWGLALAAGCVASFARWDAARRDRRAQGLCMHCGYDCHVTPDRCPECGRCPTSMRG